MLALGAESVRDFQACELFYELRHLQKEREPLEGRSMLQRRYDDSLRKVAAFFFYRRQSGLVPSYNTLLKRWEKIWFPKDMDAYDIAVEQHASMSNYASYASSAALALLRFYETFSGSTLGDPISIDQSFLVSLDRDIRLNGTYDLVLTKRHEHRVVMWWTRPRTPSADQLALDFSALKYAYEWDRGRDWQGMSITYWLYNLAAPSATLTKMDISSDDVAQFIYWARRARDTDMFVPRRGLTTYCRGCPFDSLCVAWKKWPR